MPHHVFISWIVAHASLHDQLHKFGLATTQQLVLIAEPLRMLRLTKAEKEEEETEDRAGNRGVVAKGLPSFEPNSLWGLRSFVCLLATFISFLFRSPHP
jgi:hypothetical protein